MQLKQICDFKYKNSNSKGSTFLCNHKKKLTQFWKKLLLLFFTVIAQSNTLNGLSFRIASRTFKQTLNTPPMGNPLVLLKAKKKTKKNIHLKTI